MAMKVTHTIEATGVPTGEASMAGGEPTPTQTVITHRDAQGVIVNVLDGMPGKNLLEPPGGTEADDLHKVNTGFAADLLRDGGDEAISQLIETYHLTDIPALDLDFNQFELDETESGPEAMSGSEGEPGEPANMTAAVGPATPPTPVETGVVEAEVKTSPHRPEPRGREDKIKIPSVGAFRQESGQPIWLRAYPYIKPEPVPAPRKWPQAYRGQDHYNPVWTYMRGTRRDRLKALVKQWNDAGSPTEDIDPPPCLRSGYTKGRGGLYKNPSLGLERSAWEWITTSSSSVTGSS